MPKFLSPAQIEHFHDYGYVSGIQLIEPERCLEIIERIEAFEAERPDDARWAFDIKANLLFDWVYELSADKKTLDVVEDLLGENIFNTNTVFRIKEPGSGTNYGWHQDAVRIEVDPCFLINYVSISASTPENGCLQVIPGSHKAAHPFEVVTNNDGQDKRRVARTLNVDEDKAVEVRLEPGQAVLFSGLLVHSSPSNRSKNPDNRRIAILTDYTSAEAKQSQGQGSGQLMRGRDDWGHIAPEPVPVGTCTQDNAQMRRRILNTYPENPLMGPLAPGETPQFPDDPAFAP